MLPPITRFSDLPTSLDPQYVAVDTETSGLFVDDGARLSVVSLAWWVDPEGPYDERNIQRAVLAFDQGAHTPLGLKDLSLLKRKKRSQSESLFDLLPSSDPLTASAPNHSPQAYADLLRWLHPHFLVFHHAKFDLHIMATGLRTREPRTPQDSRLHDLSPSLHWDTQRANALLFPEFKSSLKPSFDRCFPDLASRYPNILGSGPQEAIWSWINAHGTSIDGSPRFDLAPWDLMLPYAAGDAAMTLLLHSYQVNLISDQISQGLTDPSFFDLCERKFDMAITLYRMERRGVGYDVPAATEALSVLDERIKAAQVNLVHACNAARPCFFSNPLVSPTDQDMREFWYNPTDHPTRPGLGLFPHRMTDKGQISVDKEAMLQLVNQGAPAAREFQAFNQLEYARSMWYGTWYRMAGPPAPDHHPLCSGDLPLRLRTSYRQERTLAEGGEGGTISGRLAVERLQLQAIPHDYQLPPGLPPVRSFFRADPGYVIYELDLSQAEVRVAAGVARCKPMIQAFEEGLDIHSATASLMFDADASHTEWDFLRSIAKRMTLGMIYGAGIDVLVQQIVKFTGRSPSRESVASWKAQHERAYPELKRASRQAQYQVERNNFVTLAGGRRRYFAAYESSHKAFNAKIQGGVAELMEMAMIEIEASYPGLLLFQIHDSLGLEIPVPARPGSASDLLDPIASIVTSLFEKEFGLPFKMDAKVWATADGSKGV